MDYNDPLRRDGRAVECTGLENQQALIGLPGFESLSLRQPDTSFREKLSYRYSRCKRNNCLDPNNYGL